MSPESVALLVRYSPGEMARGGRLVSLHSPLCEEQCSFSPKDAAAEPFETTRAALSRCRAFGLPRVQNPEKCFSVARSCGKRKVSLNQTVFLLILQLLGLICLKTHRGIMKTDLAQEPRGGKDKKG